MTVYLWFNAVMYLLLGLWCTLWPDKTAAAVGFGFAQPGGRSEYITVYGGMEFGLGVFFLLTVLNPVWREVGLLFGLCLYGGLTVWRLYTFVAIEGITGFPRVAFALEALLLIAAVFLWLGRD